MIAIIVLQVSEGSMFSRIHLKLSDEEINERVDKMLSKPVYFNDEDIDP